MISHRCVSRSSNAVVIFASPKTALHSPKDKLVVTIGHMEPVEDRFTKFPEFTLCLADCLTSIGEKRRGLRGEYALFGQKSLHPLIRFRFQPMDECEHLTAAFSWQALAHHDLKPPFLPRRCVGGLNVPAIEADRAQWISLR